MIVGYFFHPFKLEFGTFLVGNCPFSSICKTVLLHLCGIQLILIMPTTITLKFKWTYFIHFTVICFSRESPTDLRHSGLVYPNPSRCSSQQHIHTMYNVIMGYSRVRVIFSAAEYNLGGLKLTSLSPIMFWNTRNYLLPRRLFHTPSRKGRGDVFVLPSLLFISDSYRQSSAPIVDNTTATEHACHDLLERRLR